MSFGAYLEGLVLLVVCVGALAVGGHALRRRVAPQLRGSIGAIADVVCVLGLLTLTLQAVGVIGVLDRPGVVIGCLLVGAAARAVGARGGGTGPATDAGATPTDAGTPATDTSAAVAGAGATVADTGRTAVAAVAIAGVAVVAAAWLGWTIFAYRNGMETVDTLWYHMPFAARFVQLHNIRHLHYVDGDSITAFYPANSELVHAFGLVLFANDVLSPALNLCWGALALCCAWAIGRPWRREPHCLLACLPVLATPGLVSTQPGGALTDIVTIALLLASVAVIVNGTSGRQLHTGPLAVAAVAAGLALGTKYTMIVPAIALGAGAVLVLSRGRRARHAAIWAGGLILLGGYWYLRNAIAVGNPLPSLAHLGPISLPSPHSERSYTVWEYLTDGAIWRQIFIPGLRQSLGLAWWALIAGAVGGGLLAAIDGREPARALLGAIALVSGFVFLVTPQLLGLPGDPIFFSVNVRYLAPALSLGLTLVPLARVLRGPRATAAWAAAATVALVFTALDPGVWRSGIAVKPLSPPLHGGSALAGAVAALVILAVGEWWLLHGRARRGRRSALRLPWEPLGRRWIAAERAATAAAATVALAVVFGGWAVADRYAHDRYRDSPPLPAVFAWAQHQHHARIGLVGLNSQYPLTGARSANYVQYVGVPEPHGGFTRAATCRAWRTAVDAGRYGWLLVTPDAFTSVDRQPALRWTQSSRNAQLTIRQYTDGVEVGALFRITGRLDPNSCPATA